MIVRILTLHTKPESDGHRRRACIIPAIDRQIVWLTDAEIDEIKEADGDQ